MTDLEAFIQNLPQEPTAAQVRAYIRANRPDIKVGRRGFPSREAVDAYYADHAQR